MYSVALFFLLILNLYINFEKRRARKFDTDLPTENNNNNDRNNSRRDEEISTITDMQNVPRTESHKIWRRTLHTMHSHHGSEVSTTSSYHFLQNSRGEHLYVYGAPGVNFFLRAGAIGNSEKETNLLISSCSIFALGLFPPVERCILQN